MHCDEKKRGAKHSLWINQKYPRPMMWGDENCLRDTHRVSAGQCWAAYMNSAVNSGRLWREECDAAQWDKLNRWCCLQCAVLIQDVVREGGGGETTSSSHGFCSLQLHCVFTGWSCWNYLGIFTLRIKSADLLYYLIFKSSLIELMS